MHAIDNQSPAKQRRAKKGFFEYVLETLIGSEIPFMVGGGYALQHHIGLRRPARDLDVFVAPQDAPRVLKYFAALGHPVEMTFPHWLGKIYRGRAYADIIFSSGNAVANVDPLWFEHAPEGIVLGQKVKLTPPEEMIWSKAFVMERERYDGADVNHLILGCGLHMDWTRLLLRFDPHRMVLLSHLVLYLYVYPSEAGRVPTWVWEELRADLEVERVTSHAAPKICRGTLLSRGQYLDALEKGFRDARLPPEGSMKRKDVAIWTKAALEEKEAP